jgi:hypothetical protein
MSVIFLGRRIPLGVGSCHRPSSLTPPLVRLMYTSHGNNNCKVALTQIRSTTPDRIVTNRSNGGTVGAIESLRKRRDGTSGLRWIGKVANGDDDDDDASVVASGSLDSSPRIL